jgi:hypothetical protein
VTILKFLDVGARGLLFLSVIFSMPATPATPAPATKNAAASRVQLSDSVTDGPNWTLASKGLAYEWTRPGGDYLDVKRVRNGPAHFAKVSSLGNPDSHWDVTALTRELLAENTGFHLSMTKGAIAPKFASRQSAKMPKLTVTTSDGTFNPPLLTACWVDSSANRCLGSDPADQQLSFPAMLKFDLSRIKGSVESAQLNVTYTSVYPNPAGLELAVNYLDMPQLITDPATQMGEVEGGLAATVAKDSDLAKHPAILWYPRMDSEANIRADWSYISPNYPEKRVAINPRFVDWTEYGLKALRMESQSPDNTIRGDPGSSILTWRQYINQATRQAAGGKAVGDKSYTELYVRYMLKIDPDVYTGMNELAVKLPGFEGSGFSARMLHGPPSQGNPNIFRLLIYWYGATNPFDNPNRGGFQYTKVSFKAGQIYAIEQRIKQNTRNADGTWNADGAIEIWVDGVKVFSNTAALVNNTVWPAEINNFFANFFHGGSGRPKAPMHYEFSGVALSQQYIGPAKKIRAGQVANTAQTPR